MAATITVQSNMRIVGDNQNRDYQSQQYTEDAVSGFGPSPGYMTITEEGVDVDISELESLGRAILSNYSADHSFDVGLWDGTEFYPLLEIPAGQQYPIKFSSSLGNSFGTGTGTLGQDLSLRVKANGGEVKGSIEIYER